MRFLPFLSVLLLSCLLPYILSASPKLTPNAISLSPRVPIPTDSNTESDLYFGSLMDFCADNVDSVLTPSPYTSITSLEWTSKCQPLIDRFYTPLLQGKTSASTQTSLTPAEIHLQWNGNTSTMGFSWITPNAYPDSTFTVQISLDVLGSTTCALSSTPMVINFNSSNISPCPTVGHLPYLCTQYHATVPALTPDTRYNYMVGNTNSNVWSPCYSFNTAPLPGLYRNSDNAVDYSQEFHIVFYGDQGILPYGYRVTKWIYELFTSRNSNPSYSNSNNNGYSLDMILHVGDIAYAGVSNTKAGELEFLWDIYLQQVSLLATVMPLQVTVGNHEQYYNYTSYKERFRMPNYEETQNLWWSAQWGPIYFISFSSEHDYSVGSPQYNFVLSELQYAYGQKGKSIEFIVTNCHRPLYSSDADEVGQHTPGSPLLKSFEIPFSQYGVDLFLGGHMHVTERTSPVFNGTVDNTGVSDFGHRIVNAKYPVYLTQGTAGIWIVPDNFLDPAPGWSQFRAVDYGFGLLTFSSANSTESSLLYEFFSNGSPEPMDWVEIVHSY